MNTAPGRDRLRIVLLGYVVRGPVGGMAWHHLNYIRGLADLGHEVLFMEDSDDFRYYLRESLKAHFTIIEIQVSKEVRIFRYS